MAQVEETTVRSQELQTQSAQMNERIRVRSAASEATATADSIKADEPEGVNSDANSDVEQLRRRKEELEKEQTENESQRIAANSELLAMSGKPGDQADDAHKVGEIVDGLLTTLGLRQQIPLNPEWPAGAVNASLLDDSLDVLVERALTAFRREPASRQSSENLLLAQEYLNHEVFDQYARNSEQNNMIPFRRSVEAMTLGKLMRALNNQDTNASRTVFGLGGKSSGLMRAILDLIEKTGANGDDHIDAMELLSEISLHTYLDGGMLRTGQQIKDLEVALEHCAAESFRNIRDFVAELHGMYYLFHKSGSDKTILVANASASEFRTWIEKDCFELEGSGVFGVVTGGNPDAGNIRRPGLLYLTNLAFSGNNAESEMANWASVPTLKNDIRAQIPPILVSSKHRPHRTEDSWTTDLRSIDAKLRGKAPFPWLLTGPPNLLNRSDDKEFPTLFPSAYALVAAFLERNGSSGLKPDKTGRSPSGGRIWRLSGYGSSVDDDVRTALAWFAADYYLAVIQALYEDLNASGVAAKTFFGYFWDDDDKPGQWREAVSALSGLPISGSPESFRFTSNVADTLNSTLIRQDGSIAEDTDWFLRAVRLA